MLEMAGVVVTTIVIVEDAKSGIWRHMALGAAEVLSLIDHFAQGAEGAWIQAQQNAREDAELTSKYVPPPLERYNNFRAQSRDGGNFDFGHGRVGGQRRFRSEQHDGYR
jgi:hypothetical protein